MKYPPTPLCWRREDEVAVSENFLVSQTRQQFGRGEVDTTQSWQVWAPTYTRHCPLIKQFNSSLSCSVYYAGSYLYQTVVVFEAVCDPRIDDQPSINKSDDFL